MGRPPKWSIFLKKGILGAKRASRWHEDVSRWLSPKILLMAPNESRIGQDSQQRLWNRNFPRVPKIPWVFLDDGCGLLGTVLGFRRSWRQPFNYSSACKGGQGTLDPRIWCCVVHSTSSNIEFSLKLWLPREPYVLQITTQNEFREFHALPGVWRILAPSYFGDL